MKKYILALDQGTTSSRAILFNEAGSLMAVAQKEFKQYFPKPGWVEHDAHEIWSTQAAVAAEVLLKKRLKVEQVAAIGITNQRETTVVWSRKTGRPIHKAIVWQDRRTSAYCDELKKAGHEEMIRSKTGLVVDSYFSASKVKWILDNVAGAREAANRGELLFGTIDSWLVWNLSGGSTHITDVSNASRTMLFNINTLQWDEDLLKLFGIPAAMMPEVKASSGHYCDTSSSVFAGRIPICGIAGDQQSALFGQMCLEPGMVKNTYGTGCFMMMNTGTSPIQSQNKLLTTIAWQINGETHYALEGSIFVAGAVVQWLRDGLGIIRKSSDIEKLAAEVSDSGGVYMVPAFAGLGAPHWNQDARGSIFGLTRGSTASHVARAALDSIAFQVMDVLRAMEADSNLTIVELRVDGGAATNNSLLQFQADLLQTTIVRPQITETTALGAAYLAGLGIGYWSSIEDIKLQWMENHRFNPKMKHQQVQALTKNWNRAVMATLTWANE